MMLASPHRKRALIIALVGVLFFIAFAILNLRLSTLTGYVADTNNFQEHAFLHAQLGDGNNEQISLTPDKHGIFECASTIAPSARMLGPSELGASGIQVYEFSPGFTDEKNGNWTGKRYGYDQSAENTITTFERGKTYYVKTPTSLLFRCNELLFSDAIEVEGDSDGDGLTNLEEFLSGRAIASTTMAAFSTVDTDGDQMKNWQDPDSDNDGVPDGEDHFPLDPLDYLGPTFGVRWSLNATSTASTFLNFSNTQEMASNPDVRTFSNTTVGVTGTIRKLPDDEWELTVQNNHPTNVIRSVVFPYQNPNAKFNLNTRTDDDVLYYPFRMGKASRGLAQEYTSTDISMEYPGNATSPLTVIADNTHARIVASVTFPPKRVSPYWDLKRQYLRFNNEIHPGSDPQTYNVLIKTVAGNAEQGQVPWQLALDAYKARLKPWMASEGIDPTDIPEWIKNINGWLTLGLGNMTNYAHPTGGVVPNVIQRWNAWKAYFPWMQFWGQMSNYPDAQYASLIYPPWQPGEYFGCCMGRKRVGDTMEMFHPRYIDPQYLNDGNGGLVPSIAEVAEMIRNDGGHVGFYTRPRTQCDPAITNPYTSTNCPHGDPDGNGVYTNLHYDLDDPNPLPDVIDANGNPMTNEQYLIEWMNTLETDYHANAHYVDVLACGGWSKVDTMIIPKLFKRYPTLFDDAAYECQVDYYPSIGLISGTLAMVTPSIGGENDTLATLPAVSAPMFGRYIMDNHAMFMGGNNHDYQYYGKANNYWAERQAFILGAKFDITTVTDSPPTTTALNSIIRQSVESREQIGWWAKDVVFEGTKGLAQVVPANARVTRFLGNDGKTYLAIDNYRSDAASINVTMDGITRTYSIPTDSVTNAPKDVVTCPAHPEDGPCL